MGHFDALPGPADISIQGDDTLDAGLTPDVVRDVDREADRAARLRHADRAEGRRVKSVTLGGA